MTIIELLEAKGLPVFKSPFDANLVVIRRLNQPVDIFDGSLNLFWYDEEGVMHSISCPAATRPGSAYLQKPMNSNGTAVLQAGRHTLSHAIGVHKKISPAFVQVGKVKVKRDNDLDAILDPSDKLWDDAAGINIHYVSNPKWLAGCIGISSQPELDVFLEAFKNLQKKRSQDKVSLTLVEV